MLNTEKHFAIQYRTEEGQWLDDEANRNILSAAAASKILENLRRDVSMWEFRCIAVVITRSVCFWSVDVETLDQPITDPRDPAY